MTLCVNPECRSPHNSHTAKICSRCDSQLLLRMHYRPIRVLGTGTFGQTFLAVDEDIPSKPHCAVKQFHFSSKDPEVLDKAIKLFKEEANRLDSLGTHLQIPALLACFQQDQRLYLVQEFIEGLTLQEELQQGVYYNEAQIWQLLQDLLPVLQFIHQNKVFHRDIKPPNIIRRERDGKLVLIDFGAAKLVSETHLKPGTKIGTRGYAPPEQMEHGKVDCTSDLYSLGVTCVQMLTNTPTLKMYDNANNIWRWKEYLPPRTSISIELSTILDKLLQTSVKDRYQSVEEVLHILPLHKEDGFVSWLMGEKLGRVIVNVWNWLWGMSKK